MIVIHTSSHRIVDGISIFAIDMVGFTFSFLGSMWYRLFVLPLHVLVSHVLPKMTEKGLGSVNGVKYSQTTLCV